MYLEDSFGSRQSPSLAEAMHRTPQLGQQWVYSSAGSTPNTITQAGIKSNIGSSSQQVMEPILRCSPTIVEPAYNSQPSQLLPAFDNQNLDEIEKKLCRQVDETLKMNYKKMKNKIKKVKSRVRQTDYSIHRIQKLIESVYEHIDELELLRSPMASNPIIVQELPQNTCSNEPLPIINNDNMFASNDNHNDCIQTPQKKSKKITWRRSVQEDDQVQPLSD